MLRIERYGKGRYWALYDGQELVVVTVYKRGAQEVIRRLEAAHQAQDTGTARPLCPASGRKARQGRGAMGRPGRRNAGWFRHGYDPRRHCLTTEERRRGGRTSFAYLLMHKPEVLLGLRKKLRQQQQAKQWHAQEEEERRAEAARERQLAQEGEQYPTTDAEHDLF